jgi:hypothetical protein
MQTLGVSGLFTAVAQRTPLGCHRVTKLDVGRGRNIPAVMPVQADGQDQNRSTYGE